MEAYQQGSCGLMSTTESMRDPMGLRSWTDLPLGFEDIKDRDYAGACGGNKDGRWFDMRGLPNFGFALPVPSAAIGNQNSGDFSVHSGSSAASHSSGTSYDCNSAGNVDSAEDSSLSSYLMDGNVRALLKKVTVNEGALNQTIQSLGGGEKGLKELMGYIMLWVKKNKGEDCNTFLSSQNLKKLHPPQPVNPAFGYPSSMANSSPTFNPPPGNGSCDQRHDRLNRTFEPVQSSDEALDPNQFSQRAKSRRLMDDGEVDSSIRSDTHSGRGTFVDVRGTIPDEFLFPKLEMSTGCPASIGQVRMSGMARELDTQQPVSCLQSSFSFAPGHAELSRTLAATTRAARRNRIARQRQSVLQSHTRTPSNGTAVSSGCGLWSVAPPTLDFRSAGMFHPGTQVPSGVLASSGRKVCNMDMLSFLLQKELRPSDVGNLGRIILPKKEAEMHLPVLALREGVSLQMEDFDSGYCWSIRFRFWPNNKSRMYLLENTGEFVKSHHLEEGDLLILYRNQQGNYILRGKKVHSESRGAQGVQQRNAHSLAREFPEASSKTEEVLKERRFGVGLEHRSCQKVKAEPTALVDDDDPFFKEDLMRNIGSSFGPGLLQPLERFPSLNLDFALDEILAVDPKDDNVTETEPNVGLKVAVVPKAEPAG